MNNDIELSEQNQSQEVLLEQIQKQYEEEDPLDLIRQCWQ